MLRLMYIIDFLLYKIQFWNFIWKSIQYVYIILYLLKILISIYIKFHDADQNHFDLKSYSTL